MSIYFLLSLIAAITFSQVLSLGMSFGLLLMIISRLLFFAKLYGMRVKIIVLLTLEGLGILWWLVSPILFKDNFRVGQFIFVLLCSMIVALIEFLDDLLYVYVEEEIKTKTQKKGNR